FSEYAEAIAVDGRGNIYVTGHFAGSATFGAGEPNQTVIASAANSEDVFIAKYDANGLVQWAKRGGGTGSDQGWSVAVDSLGNTYVTGLSSVSATFGTG